VTLLSDDNILQSGSGGFTASSGSATLAATTAGNTVILVAFAYGTTVSVPSGFVQDSPSVGANSQALYVFRKSNVSAGETAWTLTLGVSAPCAWTAYEISDLDLLAPLVASSPYTVASAQSASTGSTARQSSYDSIYFAAHAAYDATSATPPTWSGHTSDFTELHDQGQAGAGVSVGLSVSRRFVQQVNTYSSTATSTLAAAGPVVGVMIGYAASWAKQTGGVTAFWGFEWGTGNGLTAGPAGGKHFVSTLGTPTVTSEHPRSGSYAAKFTATSSTCATIINTSGNDVVVRAPFYLDGLPSTDVQLFSILTGGPVCFAWYRAATQKVGVVISGGAEQASASTVAAGAYHVLEVRFKVNTSDYTADWQLNGTDQAQATSTSTPLGSAIDTVRLGWATNATAVVFFDDVLVSSVANNYPLGDQKVVPLKVDPAGTFTVSGTTTRFNTWTANGTMASWDATTARGAVDELPPTVGASSDGVAVVTGSTTDYVEMPMETYSLSVNEAIRAVRMIVCGWAATSDAAANPTSIKFEAWDGSGVTTVWSEVTSTFDDVNTKWIVKPVTPSSGEWTQAKLDALAFRMYSNDATPDVGIHAIYAEALIAIAQNEVLFGDPGGLYVEAKRDPITNGLLGFVVTTPADRGATVDYEVNGVADSTGFIAANSTHTEILQAPDFPTINLLTLKPG
jgi:hypothetical protein